MKAKYIPKVLKKNSNSQSSKFFHRKISFTDFISVTALIVAAVTFYFQFFNVNHEILYSFLTPEVNNNINQLNIPIYFKNTGNQTELILDGNLLLEVKTDNNENYYKRIGDSNKDQFPIILNSNESKLINLKFQYKDYLFGMLEISPDSINFRDFTILDSLKFIMTTQFLTTDGYLSNDTLDIGYVTFEQSKISQLDYNSVELRSLELDSDTRMLGGRIVNQTISGHVDMNNPNDLKKAKALLRYMQKSIADTNLKYDSPHH